MHDTVFSIHTLKALVVILFTAFVTWHGAVPAAEPISDSAALNGVKEAKAVFLVDIGNAKKTALYLDIIGDSTHARLERQGVKPDFVLVFIGPTVKFITTKPEDEIALEFEDELKSIASSVKRLDDLGVRMEVCSVATEVFGIRNETLLPEMDLVGDGFVSVIGWQAQGYQLVPVY